MKIDLHIHTKTCSDGNLSIEEVFQEAKNRNIDLISITDHDSIDCQERAIALARKHGMSYITGVELNVTFHYPEGNKDVSLDFLGYGYDIGNQELGSKLQLIKEHRERRARQILKNLNVEFEKEGIEGFTEEDLRKIENSVDGVFGRPHIANYLVEKGLVKDKQEAFDKYLGKGAPAYLDKFRLSAIEAITMITDAGGIPVLAHPFTLYCKSSDELDVLIKKLVNQGLQGLEVYYSEHDERKMSSYKLLAKRYNLAITGGSDFHGKNIKGIDLGTGRGKLKIPYTVLENLKTIREEKRK